MLMPLDCADADAEAERERRRAAWSDLADAAGRAAELATQIEGSGAEAVQAMARAVETLAGSCVNEETAELRLAAAQVGVGYVGRREEESFGLREMIMNVNRGAVVIAAASFISISFSGARVWVFRHF